MLDCFENLPTLPEESAGQAMSERLKLSSSRNTPLVIEDVVPVGVSFMLWGYAFTGDGSEFSAVISEDNETVVLNTYRNGCSAWDRDRSYLDSVERWYGDKQLQTPWWWALPCVTEMKLRKAGV